MKFNQLPKNVQNKFIKGVIEWHEIHDDEDSPIYSRKEAKDELLDADWEYEEAIDSFNRVRYECENGMGFFLR